MTEKEKQEMMSEITSIVEKYITMSDNKDEKSKDEPECYRKPFRISDKEMSEWKKQYKAMRCDTKAVLEQVMRNPIDTSCLESSFDISYQERLL